MAGEDLVVEAFTELAPHYEEVMDRELQQYWGLTYTEFNERLVAASAVKDGELVLDVATGTARIPLAIAGRRLTKGQIVGLDITPALLKAGLADIQAGQLALSLGLTCASAMAMPFSDQVFDVAICGLASHHMEVPRLLSGIRRVLRAGGRLVIVDAGASAFWRSWWGTAVLKTLVMGYQLRLRGARAQAEVKALPNIRTAGEWRALLAELGFVGIDIAEHQARHAWYPCILMVKAVVGGRSDSQKQVRSSV